MEDEDQQQQIQDQQQPQILVKIQNFNCKDLLDQNLDQIQMIFNVKINEQEQLPEDSLPQVLADISDLLNYDCTQAQQFFQTAILTFENFIEILKSWFLDEQQNNQQEDFFNNQNFSQDDLLNNQNQNNQVENLNEENSEYFAENNKQKINSFEEDPNEHNISEQQIKKQGDDVVRKDIIKKEIKNSKKPKNSVFKLKEDQREDNLKEIFAFYCRQQFSSNVKYDFDLIFNQYNGMSVGMFIIFCRQFDIIEQKQLPRLPDNDFKKKIIQMKEQSDAASTKPLPNKIPVPPANPEIVQKIQNLERKNKFPNMKSKFQWWEDEEKIDKYYHPLLQENLDENNSNRLNRNQLVIMFKKHCTSENKDQRLTFQQFKELIQSSAAAFYKEMDQHVSHKFKFYHKGNR